MNQKLFEVSPMFLHLKNYIRSIKPKTKTYSNKIRIG